MDKNINFLMPVHRKLSESEVSALMEKYSISSTSKLPKIKISDPALQTITPALGDVIEIIRISFAGENKYYRVVIE